MTTATPYAHKWIAIDEAASITGVTRNEMDAIVKGAPFDTIRDMWTGEVLMRLSDIRAIRVDSKEAK